jgi:3-hydroxyisobutyrate dehydrogenase
VTTGAQGAFQSMKEDAVFIDHTTASAIVARELSAFAAARKFSFLDAPVSGGQAGAEKGALTIMVGGDDVAFQKAKSIMNIYALGIEHMGPSGSGQLAKMANQICIANNVQGLAEAISFAKNAGLNIDKLLAALGKGGAGSWQMENRGKTMAEGKFDFGFAVNWIRKDLGMCLEEAKRNGTSLPVTALIDQYYADIQQLGGGRWDTSSLIKRFPQKK